MATGLQRSSAPSRQEAQRARGRLRALVSGASAGIGQALARRLAQEGFDLVLVARRAAPLEALAGELRAAHGVAALALPADLAEPGAVAALAAKLRRRRLTVDLLVNNAGVLALGDFVATPPDELAALVALNVGALTQMLAHFVPPMVSRGQGRVLNVASVAAFQPVPALAAYAASKAYVLSLTEALAEELRGSGVSVTALCPGITATSMLSGAQRRRGALNRLPAFVVGDADAVAADGVAACLAGEVVCVSGAFNRAANWAGRTTPRALLRRLSGALVRGIRS